VSDQVIVIYLLAESESGAGVREWKSQRDVIDRCVVGASEQVRGGYDVIVRVGRLVETSHVRQLAIGTGIEQLERLLSHQHQFSSVQEHRL